MWMKDSSNSIEKFLYIIHESRIANLEYAHSRALTQHGAKETVDIIKTSLIRSLTLL